MFNLEEINQFNKYYDRIEYLAEKIKKVRKALIKDDWALFFYMKQWTNT